MKMQGRGWTAAVARGFLWLLLPTVVAALQLPLDIQADRHLVRAQRQIEEQDYAGAKQSMDRILELESQHGLQIPEEFFFRYAEVLRRLDLYDEATETATKYLTLTGRDGQHYREALELLDEMEQAKAAALKAAEAARRRAEAAKERRCDWWTSDSRDAAAAWKRATVELVSECLDRGADPNIDYGDAGYGFRASPLYFAGFRDAALVEALLKAGARPTSGHLERVVRFGRQAVVEMLLATGLEPTGKAMWGAIIENRPSVVKALLAAGADLNEPYEAGFTLTPLQRAIYELGRADSEDTLNKSVEIVKALLAAGANPNAPDEYSKTGCLLWKTVTAPLSEPMAKEIVEMLLAAGANRREKCGEFADLKKYHRTALEEARRLSRPSLIQALKR